MTHSNNKQESICGIPLTWLHSTMISSIHHCMWLHWRCHCSIFLPSMRPYPYHRHGSCQHTGIHQDRISSSRDCPSSARGIEVEAFLGGKLLVRDFYLHFTTTVTCCSNGFPIPWKFGSFGPRDKRCFQAQTEKLWRGWLDVISTWINPEVLSLFRTKFS